MRNTVVAVTALSALLLVGGCATAPTESAKPVAVARPVTTPSAPVIVAPKLTAQPLPSTVVTANGKASTTGPIAAPKLSPEAAALVERLTVGGDSETLPHEMADSTAFSGAMESLQPGAHAPRVEITDNSSQPPPRGLTADGNSTALVERDWTGLVLVPISKSLSKAHTSDVQLKKVEAHPLTDGRVRIWARVQNTGGEELPAEIACEFRMKGQHLTSPYFYRLDVPASGYRDVFFVSPDGDLNSYTVLVRSIEALSR
ncbi:MAG TPA: hypothetical protein VFT72_08485 [Opitutaceae bacterium]|nr:hypothetical protein [Opitutaceae bacterium]